MGARQAQVLDIVPVVLLRVEPDVAVVVGKAGECHLDDDGDDDDDDVNRDGCDYDGGHEW